MGTRWLHRRILACIFFKLFQKIEEERILPRSIYEATITKTKDTTKEENDGLVSLISIGAKINKILAILSNITLKGSNTVIKPVYPRGAKTFQYPQINQCDTA